MRIVPPHPNKGARRRRGDERSEGNPTRSGRPPVFRQVHRNRLQRGISLRLAITDDRAMSAFRKREMRASLRQHGTGVFRNEACHRTRRAQLPG